MRSEPADLAAAHRDVLLTIAQLQNGQLPKGNEIANNCAVGPDHVYHILEVLGDNELIARHPDPDDNRVLRNAISDQGRAVLEELQTRYTKSVCEAAIILSAQNRGFTLFIIP